MSLAIKQGITPRFGRHESFTVRYSWLKKGYDIVADPDLTSHQVDMYPFSESDVHLTLGVGKNMARSIRFWIQAARLVEEVTSRRVTHGYPTVFGQRLLDNTDGFDPYLEDVATWWLLHWMMVSPGGSLPVWWIAFHTFSPAVFDADRFNEHLAAEIESTPVWEQKATNPSSIRKDALAFLRMYAGPRRSTRREHIDDLVDSPFVQLSLIRPAEGKSYRFGLGPKPGLSENIAAFACLDFLSRTGFTGRQALITSLASEQGNPGRAFKLSESDLTDLLEKAAVSSPDLLSVSRVGGSPALAIQGEQPLGVVAAQLAYRHYASCGYEGPEPSTPLLPWSQEIELTEAGKLVRDERAAWT